MPENPHWYTLRKGWPDDAAFVEAVLHMREFGYKEKYEGRWYTMYNLNGFKYWTMGAPINYRNGNPCTILINRKPLDYAADYDLIADRYDSLFRDRASLEENEQIFTRVGAKPTDRVLDIGCGTGLFLEYNSPWEYVGLDPSTRMLSRFVSHIRCGQVRLVNARLEEFYDGDGFDLIVALFGAASYITPAYFSHIYDYLKPGGRIFAMFYQERYVPVTYEKCGVSLPHHSIDEYKLDGWQLTKHRDSFWIAEI
jgi:SAM-dependent methyltransferase